MRATDGCSSRGLLRGGERRNAGNIAEAIDGPPVRTLQAFLATGVWSDAAILARMRADLLAVLADDDAVLNADETGFPKKGTKSVGVKRQYSGTLGRTDNCQVGVFLNYARCPATPFWTAACSCRGSGPTMPSGGPRAGAGGGGVPHQAAVGPGNGGGRGRGRGAVPVGRRGQRVRGQPDVRPGGAGVGQVVRRRYVGRRPRLDRGAAGDSGETNAGGRSGGERRRGRR